MPQLIFFNFFFFCNSTYSLYPEHWIIQEPVNVLHLITCHGRIVPRLAELLLLFFFFVCFFVFFTETFPHPWIFIFLELWEDFSREFESAMVNEPSVFESFEFYCIRPKYLCLKLADLHPKELCWCFHYFSTIIYIVGTQEEHFNKNICLPYST